MQHALRPTGLSGSGRMRAIDCAIERANEPTKSGGRRTTNDGATGRERRARVAAGDRRRNRASESGPQTATTHKISGRKNGIIDTTDNGAWTHTTTENPFPHARGDTGVRQHKTTAILLRRLQLLLLYLFASVSQQKAATCCARIVTCPK